MASFYVGEAYHPTRSVSLPCRFHPRSYEMEIKLSLLKARESFPSISAAGATLQAHCMQMDLSQLEDLYNCIQKMINSASIQRSVVLQNQRERIEEALDMSIELIDVCGFARDLFLMMKESVQDLQSALRRKGGELSIKRDIRSYICFRKKAKSDIAKKLRVLKIMKSNVSNIKSIHGLNIHDPMEMVFNELRELSSITISITQSLLLFITMPVLTKGGCHSLFAVSKLMSNKGHRGEKKINEVGKVDVTLCSLHKRIGKRNYCKAGDVQVMKRRLDAVDSSIEVLEDGVDRLFRCLIKHRVSLLNLLTP